MDILKALADDSAAARGASRCALGAWLDSIPDEVDGRDELIRLVETDHNPRNSEPETMSGDRIAAVVSKLGHPISTNPLLKHRNRGCRCYR